MKRLILLAPIFLAQLLLADPLPQTRTAVFAGGCFWCIQPAFDKAPGVIKLSSATAGEPSRIRPTHLSAPKRQIIANRSKSPTIPPKSISTSYSIFTGGRSIPRNPTASLPILDQVIAPPSLCRTTKSERSRKHQRRSWRPLAGSIKRL